MDEWEASEDDLEKANRLFDEGAYEEALRACRRVLQTDPGCAEAQALAGRCLAYLNRVDEAERELLAALDIDRECVEAWFGLAFVSWLRADDREAIGYLERARQLAPEDEVVLAQLVGTYGNLGRYDEAKRLYQEALDLHPTSAQVAYQWGMVLAIQGRYDEALGVWRRAAEWDEGFPDLHLAMARAYAQKGDWGRAHKALKRELELYPDSRDARLALGGYYAQRGNLKRAVKVYEDLLAEVQASADESAAQDDPRIHLELGVAYKRLGEAVKARRHLLRALELSPSDSLILSEWTGVSRSKTDVSRAKRVLRRALREEPHRDELYRNLSALFAEEGRFDEAEQELRRAMAFSGRAHELENDLGVLLAIQGRFDEARQAFDRGLARRRLSDSSLPEGEGAIPLRINRALIEADLGRLDEAVARLQALAEAVPSDRDVLGNLASVLLEAGKAGEALEVAQRLCREAPFDARGYYLVGRARYDGGRYAEALEALDRAARLEPAQVDILIAMGMCYAGLGRPEECVRAFKRVRSLSPNNPDVLFNLALAYEEATSVCPAMEGRREAMRLYRRVLDLAPRYESARQRLEALAGEGAE